MDGSRFDFLAKAMHQAPSRRRFLGGLAGAAGAVVAGRASLDAALAQEVGATKFDLACKQGGVGYFCVDPAPDVTVCRTARGCVCARGRQNNARVCIEEFEGDCPGKRQGCRKNSQCKSGEVCVKVPSCCPQHPGRGVCARRCAE